MWKRLLEALLRPWRWPLADSTERDQAAERARFWAELREGEGEAEREAQAREQAQAPAPAPARH